MKGDGSTLQSRIATCGKDLQNWGEKIRLKFKADIQQCRDQLEHLKKLRIVNFYSQIAEQSWRLLTEPNSLASSVLKSRYFTHENFGIFRVLMSLLNVLIS